MMNSIVTKWGSVIIVTIITGILLLSLVSSTAGISTWISDTYLPKKYLIIEYGGMRFIMYGQFAADDEQKCENNTTKKFDTGKYVLRILSEIKTVVPIERTYEYPVDVEVDSNFNSRQIRSSQRNTKKHKDDE